MSVYFVMLIQTLVASGTHIVAKSVTGSFDPLVLTTLRGLIASAGLAVLFSLRRGMWRIQRSDAGSMMFLGFCGTANQALYLFGLRYTTAANAALLYGATPVLVLILSGLMRRERATARRTAGILLAFGGVSVVIFERGLSLSSEYTAGNLIVAGAVLLWALYTILGKTMVLRHGALKTTTLTTTMGTGMVLASALVWSEPPAAESLTWGDAAGVAYLGFGTSILSYLLWYYALGRIGATRLAVFANGQPIIATLLSVVFLHATVSGMFLIGGSITIAGVLITQWSGTSQGVAQSNTQQGQS